MRLFILVSFIILLGFSSKAQEYYDSGRNKKLFDSGKERVKVYSDSGLWMLFSIHTAKRIITRDIFKKTASVDATNLPSYNDSLSISGTKKWFYSEERKLDSTINTYYTPKKIVSVLRIYTYPKEGKAYRTQANYRIENGERTKLSETTEYYEYDDKDRLIKIKNEDKTDKIWFELDFNGRIAAQFKEGFYVPIRKYKYDKKGRMIRKTFVKAYIEYEYNEESLIIRETYNNGMPNNKFESHSYVYE